MCCCDCRARETLQYRYFWWIHTELKSNVTYFLGESVKLRKATTNFIISVCVSVCPHGIVRLTLDGFSWKLIFECFSKICRRISGLIKIGQEYWLLYVKTNTHFWSYLSQFFLEWEMFQTKHIDKIKTYILCSVTVFLSKILPFVM